MEHAVKISSHLASGQYCRTRTEDQGKDWIHRTEVFMWLDLVVHVMTLTEITKKRVKEKDDRR